jgi:hypothetical protein
MEVKKKLFLLFVLFFLIILFLRFSTVPRLNHLPTDTIQTSLNSTVAFIVPRMESDPLLPVQVNCAGFFIEERLIVSALHCFQNITTYRIGEESFQIPTLLDPTGTIHQFVFRNQLDSTTLIAINDDINEATVVAINMNADLAILELTEETPPGRNFLTLSVNTPEITETVYVVGHPSQLIWSISEGTISRLLFIREGLFFQTSISIIGGYSGGPLIDSSGEVVGVASAYLRHTPRVSFFIASQQVLGLVMEYSLSSR